MNSGSKTSSRSEKTHATSVPPKVVQMRSLIAKKNEHLLDHAYFRRCRSKQLTRSQVLDIVKQLYCFSVFFERILARRIAEYSSSRDKRVIDIARIHMRDEIGHSRLFYDCLVANGASPEDLAQLAPAMFTKAMFGYLTVTIQHEDEFVSNVAIMQVMESIGFHFFSATLKLMEAHAMLAEPMIQHTEDDEGHSELGVELAAEFDEVTARNCERVIDDLYRLMSFVLDEWMGTYQELRTAPSQRARRSSRPPRRFAAVS
jgi:pyrroloquinoline quinone (PQQ) biosynthesis protein C